jgi:hypothetical protein
MTDASLPQDRHPAVQHPGHLVLGADLRRYQRSYLGGLAEVNDRLAVRLGRIFGSAWMVWSFFVLPLAARFLGPAFQSQFFYYSSGWVQLFALPLFVYIGNRLQKSTDAQSEVMHRAMTHIATVSDQSKTLIEQNTELTRKVHDLTAQVRSLVAPAG